MKIARKFHAVPLGGGVYSDPDIVLTFAERATLQRALLICERARDLLGQAGQNDEHWARADHGLTEVLRERDER